MDNAQHCRSMALLCRQQAVLHPDQNWKWLGQAERWEHLADAAARSEDRSASVFEQPGRQPKVLAQMLQSRLASHPHGRL